MNSRRIVDRTALDPTMDQETANELRDSNDPIYPDVERDAQGQVHVGNHNTDPVSGEHGSHPVGSGLGAAAGGTLAGIGLGAAAGPVGAAIGALVGGLAGGLAGKSIAEAIDPTVEDAYWRQEYPRRDYYRPGIDYEVIQAAYQHGWQSRARYKDLSWDQAHADVRRQWESQSRDRMLGTWEDAQRAIRDAWDRAEQQLKQDQRGSSINT